MGDTNTFGDRINAPVNFNETNNLFTIDDTNTFLNSNSPGRVRDRNVYNSPPPKYAVPLPLLRGFWLFCSIIIKYLD